MIRHCVMIHKMLQAPAKARNSCQSTCTDWNVKYSLYALDGSVHCAVLQASTFMFEFCIKTVPLHSSLDVRNKLMKMQPCDLIHMNMAQSTLFFSSLHKNLDIEFGSWKPCHSYHILYSPKCIRASSNFLHSTLNSDTFWINSQFYYMEKHPWTAILS